MPVTWEWTHKIGEISVRREEKKDEFINFKLNIYSGNCLAIVLYEFKDSETKESKYNFWCFWNDLQHLKRCLGLKKGYNNLFKDEGSDNWTKIKLNTYYSQSIKMADLFAKAGHKVELYYKPFKAKKIKIK